MVLRVGEAIELAAILEAHGDVLFARELNDFFHARILASLRDYDAIECAACFEGLLHRVDSGQLVHFFRLLSQMRRKTPARARESSLPCRGIARTKRDRPTR